MADIRSYLKEKEKREKNQENYKVKIRKHRLTAFYRVLLVLLAVGALMTLVIIQYRKHVYTGYDIVSSIPRESISDSYDVRLGNAILTYSKDGAHSTDFKGNVLWNQTYQMQDIKLAICRNVAAIGNWNGRNIYIGGADRQLGEITTSMPIQDLAVSATGRVAVIMSDANMTHVNTYSPDGQQLYDGKFYMHSAGYPTALALSPNGEMLGISFTYLDAGVMKTNIAFYNFGPVGDNQSDHFMSGYTYSDLFVPYIRFLDDETSFAVGDSRLMIYKGAQKPVIAAEYLYDQEVCSVHNSDKYIGLVFYSDTSEARYRMDVYDNKAAQVGSFYFDMDYTDIFFGQDNFTVYSDTECMVMTLQGMEKYSGRFSQSVRLMIPIGNSYKYLLVTDNSLDTIQLK